MRAEKSEEEYLPSVFLGRVKEQSKGVTSQSSGLSFLLWKMLEALGSCEGLLGSKGGEKKGRKKERKGEKETEDEAS